ncbi:MAG: hypothetical protein IRY96_05085, partial [Burkholderiales bacterium]|nr:hypothetical protein [Burkholderiales bacterium]
AQQNEQTASDRAHGFARDHDLRFTDTLKESDHGGEVQRSKNSGEF